MITWESLPIEIKLAMFLNQALQGNPHSKEPFKQYIKACGYAGGFYWEDSIEGEDFWIQVLEKGNLNYFYTEYPKSKVVVKAEGKEDSQEKIKTFEDSIAELRYVISKFAEKHFPSSTIKLDKESGKRYLSALKEYPSGGIMMSEKDMQKAGEHVLSPLPKNKTDLKVCVKSEIKKSKKRLKALKNALKILNETT